MSKPDSKYDRITLYLGEAGSKNRLEAAVKALGYPSVSNWVQEQVKDAIAEANGQTTECPTTSRMTLVKRLSATEEQAEKLGKKLGDKLPRLRELYVEAGGSLNNIDNLDEVLPKLYVEPQMEISTIAIFEQYARLKKQVFETKQRLGPVK